MLVLQLCQFVVCVGSNLNSKAMMIVVPGFTGTFQDDVLHSIM